MTEGKKNEDPDDNGYWPETRKAVRFLLWTLVFLFVGVVVLSATGIKLLSPGGDEASGERSVEVSNGRT